MHFLALRGLAITPATVAIAEPLLVARRRGRYLGASVALVALAVSALALPSSLPARWAPWTGLAMVTFAATATLAAIGGVAGAALVRPAADGPRAAHAARPAPGDVLPPLLRWWSLLALGGTGLLTAAFLLAPPADRWLTRPAAVWGLAGATAAVGGCEAVTRWLVARPRPAASSFELAVRDEITGDEIASLAGAPGPAVMATLLALQWSPAAGAVCLPLVVVPLLVEGRRRHWVGRRLWHHRHPALPADEGPVPSSP